MSERKCTHDRSQFDSCYECMPCRAERETTAQEAILAALVALHDWDVWQQAIIEMIGRQFDTDNWGGVERLRAAIERCREAGWKVEG